MRKNWHEFHHIIAVLEMSCRCNSVDSQMVKTLAKWFPENDDPHMSIAPVQPMHPGPPAPPGQGYSKISRFRVNLCQFDACSFFLCLALLSLSFFTLGAASAEVLALGLNGSDQTTVQAALSNVVAIAAGGHSLELAARSMSGRWTKNSMRRMKLSEPNDGSSLQEIGWHSSR